MLLRWTDVDWVNERLTVHSPKTAKQGKPNRQIPLCWIHSELTAVREAHSDGSEFIFTSLRKNTNLRTTFKRIIKRAGLTPWPKLVQNLRVSKQNDLERDHRMTAVAAFIGNSVRVAEAHYLHATDEDFKIATQKNSESVEVSADFVQHSAAPACTEEPPVTSNEKKAHVPLSAALCNSVQVGKVPPRGAKLSDDSPGNRPVSKAGEAEYGPLEVEIPLDAELVELILSWHELPEETKILVSRHFHDL